MTTQAVRPNRHDFSPIPRTNRVSSNTDQKVGLSAPLIDWCTVVLDAPAAQAFCRSRALKQVVQNLFEPAPAIAVGALLDLSRNYYPRSACLMDCTGACVGMVAVRDDGAVQIALSGLGCQYVGDWSNVADRLDAIGGHVSRVDIAVDDLTGHVVNVPRFKSLLVEGAFTNRGRPPSGRFIDDMGTGKGCTLYIGQRGHKQLCVYEKGKQLGDSDSRHTRCELRLYGKRLVLPNNVLRTPGAYFRGAYQPLRALVGGELQGLRIKEALVEAHATSMVRALRRQSGRVLGLLDEAFGENAQTFLANEVLRRGRPSRFRGISGNLAELVRQQLAHKITSAPGVGCDALAAE